MKLVNDLSKHELQLLVEKHQTLSDVLRELGYRHRGCSIKTLKNRLLHFGIESEKFKGKSLSGEVSGQVRYEEYISRWKEGKESGHTGKGLAISRHVRKFLYLKYENKCSGCGWNKVNPYTNKIPLEVHHIDGNPSNNKEDNLQLLCGCCHSLTPNFRARNKNSPRKHR